MIVGTPDAFYRAFPEGTAAMVHDITVEARSHLVLVVGIDLSDVSAHLLAIAQSLVRSVDEAELHVVHVGHHESLAQRLAEGKISVGIGERAKTELARGELERLCEAVVHTLATRVVLHTPVGRPADELVRIAHEVNAGMIVIEAHDSTRVRGVLHRSVVARVARKARCSVLTVRPAQPPPVLAPTADRREVFEKSAEPPPAS